MEQRISKIYWLWIPIITMAIQIVLEITLSGEILSRLHSENGPHELIEFFILVLSFVVCLLYFFKTELKNRLLNFWFGLAAICCFYVAGEEISWGQHIWDWATPEYWKEVNDQEETNLHNTSSWFDQKPRLILLIGIVFGGLIAPFLKIKNYLKLPQNLDFIMPSPLLGVIAGFVIIPHILEKTFKIFDINIFARFSEVEELYMFYFVLLYLVMLYQKVIKLQKT
ncbi:MAG: hypothetical protein R3D88_04050 [Alphaproteobacteria bacterium]